MNDTLDATQTLYYGFGHVLYAIAMADGNVTPEEQRKTHQILDASAKRLSYDFNLADIIFQILEKEHFDAETTYQWGLKEIGSVNYKLTPALIERFHNIIDEVALKLPAFTTKEAAFVARFKADLQQLV